MVVPGLLSIILNLSNISYKMKEIILFRDWHAIRWVRLFAGSYFAWQGFVTHDSFSAFIGSFLLLQAFTNTGCCGTGGCGIPDRKIAETNEKEDIEYTIIKP